jgi:hypothetical protein
MKKREGFDLTKAMSFLLVFVSLCMVIGVGFLVPTVRNINKQTMLLEVESRSYKGIKERYDDENAKLNALKKENETLISALGTSFNPVTFQKSQKSKMGSVQLQKTSNEMDGDYFIDKYSVAIAFDNPKSLFEFIDSIDHSGSLIKIVTPLSIASTANKGIAANFYLRAITVNLGTKKDINATENIAK